MLEGKAVIGETDMLQTMQQDALDLASKALDFFDVTEAIEIARFIKKVKKNKKLIKKPKCWDSFECKISDRNEDHFLNWILILLVIFVCCYFAEIW